MPRLLEPERLAARERAGSPLTTAPQQGKPCLGGGEGRVSTFA
jgi:hypothetical protein